MARWQSKTILLNLAVFAVFDAGCSRSKPDDNLTTARSDAMSAAKAAPVPPAATPAPQPAATGSAVLQATISLPDGGNCSATVDSDCQECMLKKCEGKAPVDACDALTGNAAAGPAAGKARSRLCREALDCIRRTKCHSNSLIDCYCGDIDLGTCHLTTTDAKGLCKSDLDRALEVRPGSAGSAALNVITEPNVAGGIAGIVATCENTACAHLCIPYRATGCR